MPHTLTHALTIAARRIASEVAAKYAAEVDAQARFPSETIDALREARLLSAAIPVELGGAGLTIRELADGCAAIAQGCASSAMVLAMHHIQVACMVQHGLGAPFFRQYLKDLATQQWLLASMTSEVGTSGDTRSSICAVERPTAAAAQGRFVLNKDATTGSYCAHADAILVTCRRNAQAAASDQVLVLVRKQDYNLRQTTTWDTMGMRGTCSPGFRLESGGSEVQILPGPYADCSARTMVPYSHILWSALWHGIATDAVSRAAAYVRGEARKKPGEVPATALLLARVSQDLQTMRHHWQSVAGEYDQIIECAPGTAGSEGLAQLLSMSWALKLNHLKAASSEAAPRIVHQALQIIGILGFKNDSPLSVTRHYRDALSGALMVSNERIAAKSASMLLVVKEE